MLANLEYRQLVRWRLFDQTDPIGGARLDQAAAVVASTVWNRHRTSREKAAKLEDFVPKYKRPHRRTRKLDESVMEAQKAMARELTLLLGGKILTPGADKAGKRG